MSQRPVFVLRLDLDWMNHAELAVARSLGRLGVPVMGVKGGAAVASSRFSSGRRAFDPHGETGEQLDRLQEIGAELGRPVLIPVDDPATVFVDRHAEHLSEAFVFPQRPNGLSARLAHKGRMHELCRELGIPVPEAAFPHTREDVEAYAAEAAFPLVLKRMAAWATAVDRTSVRIVHDRESLLAAYTLMESPGEPNVMLQEHVPGDPTSIWMFNGYFDDRSRCVTGFTGTKIRQSDDDTGATSLGVCRPNPEINASARRLMSAVGYRGIVDMGYRYDARDGRYKLLDVNPRLGSTFRLFVDGAGNDVLRALYLDLLGERVSQAEQCAGRKWMAENLDLVSAMRALRAGRITVREWLGSLRGVQEGAWFAADDPLPFGVMCLEFPLLVARRRLRASRARAG